MIEKLKDGFKNILKGLGGDKDPNQYTTFVSGIKINQILAENLYVYWWLAGKIVDVPIDDATKKWRKLIIDDPEEKGKVEKVFKEFDIKGKINEGMKLARIYGGAVIIPIIDGQDLEDELKIESIQENSLKDFIVLDRYNIEPDGINRDLLSGNFGKPEYYTVNRGGQKIHHTRVIRFPGSPTPLRKKEENNYWDDSIFTKLFEPMKDAGTTTKNIQNLIWEAVVDVYRIDGLHDMVAANDDDLVKDRLKIAHEMKSILNGLVLDKNDEYEKRSNVFAGLAELDDRSMQKVAGAADIPLTRLLGTSPTGMNATGESDMLNYYDNVKSIQENKISPVLEKIDVVVMMSAFGSSDSLKYEWEPLRQLTEKEQAEVETARASRDETYQSMGVINNLDILSQLAEEGTYVTIDVNRIEEEKKLAEELEEEMEEFEEIEKPEEEVEEPEIEENPEDIE